MKVEKSFRVAYNITQARRTGARARDVTMLHAAVTDVGVWCGDAWSRNSVEVEEGE